MGLVIPDGSYCCLLGPSGRGKTTTLRLIAGHERLSAGDVLIGDRVVNGLPPVARGTAMMFQSYALFPHLTCADNVAFALRVRGVGKAERRERAQAQLARVHMGFFAEFRGSCCEEEVPAQEVELGAAVHAALQKLETSKNLPSSRANP